MDATMQRKLTLTIDEDVYKGLREVVGPRKISHFVEGLVRPHVLKTDLYAAYRSMAVDRVREAEAFEWAEATATMPPISSSIACRSCRLRPTSTNFTQARHT